MIIIYSLKRRMRLKRKFRLKRETRSQESAAAFLVIPLFAGLAFSFLSGALHAGRYQAASSPPRPNIVFVVIDSLRRDHLSHFGYFRPTSPQIDRLCQQGVLFRQVISQSSQTGPSVSSFWTGLYPCHHGIQLYSYNQSYHPFKREVAPRLDTNLKTLAEYLQDIGYTTLGIVANPWLRAEFGFDQGFDFYHWLANAEGQHLIHAFRDSLIKVLNSSENRNSGHRPFFAYLHFMDTHAPYMSPSGPKNLFTQFKGEPVYGMGYKDYLSSDALKYAIALYDEQIRRVDDFVGELINFLKQNNLLEKTLLILAPDHGEEFYEHLGLGHGVNLYSEVIDIFFLFYFPGHFPPQEINLQVQGVDLLPTLLDFLHISRAEGKLDGQSLLPLIVSWGEKSSFRNNKRLALSELGEKKALIQGKWKFIYDLFLQTEELYNLESDPRERLNLVDEETTIRWELKNKLFSILKAAGESIQSPSRLSGELREKLKSLGYVGAGDMNLREGEKILNQPISAQIDFSRPQFNPLQLVYGWKKKEKGIKEDKTFYQVGPFVKFVLKPPAKRKASKLIIEGKNKINLIPGHSLCLDVYMERKHLARFWLQEKKEFVLTLNLPEKISIERSVEFLLNWQIIPSNTRPKLITNSLVNNSNLAQDSNLKDAYLLISKISLL